VRSHTAFVPVLAGAAVMLMTVPLLITGDQLLTSIAQGLHVDDALGWLTPGIARLTAAMLGLFGVHAATSGADVLPQIGDTYSPAVAVSWNCLGWQSLVLAALSLTVGLRGERSWAVRAGLVFAALVGTVLVNVLRIAVVCVLAARWGYSTALLFHDYGGAVLVIAWLCLFWAVAYGWVLDPGDGDDSPGVTVRRVEAPA
jgi:exosortase/archaeosortase family protein